MLTVRTCLVTRRIKNPPVKQATRVPFLGWEDPLEKGMATHSSILDWRIPWTEEPGGLQSMGPQRVGHDWATNTPILSLKMSPVLQFREILLWERSLVFFLLAASNKSFLLLIIAWLCLLTQQPPKRGEPSFGIMEVPWFIKTIQRLREDIKLNVNWWVRSNL